MSTLQFKGIIKILNINPYILVSRSRATKLKAGWKKPLPVLVRINSQPKKAWRINMMPVGNGSFYLYLHASVRDASQTKVGDKVDVELKFDEDYKSGPVNAMPVELSKAFKRHPKAKTAWKALTPSRQKEVLRYFASLKTAESRERNLAKIVHVLMGNTARFMARTWEKGK